MKNKIGFALLVFIASVSSFLAQTKVSGIILDKQNKPVPFVNVVFKNSNVSAMANEDGRFYIESPVIYKSIVLSSVGFLDKEVVLEKSILFDFKIVMNSAENLNEVVIYSGKTSKKNNPALDILRKIWERRRKNGLSQFAHYQMKKYEKVEFDMNTIDSAFMKNKLFKGMEFIFNHIDTSKVTGKCYLPIFINESLYDVYGNNKLGKRKEILTANKNSGFSDNQHILAFVNDLYSEYNIYDNHLTFFDKSFTSPLSRTGIDVYNYVLRDSSFVDKKWCYNILFYPRRKNELTFKGDFWVNDTTFAIKKINMAVTKSANINWVKDIYIEQEFDVQNDSIFLLTRDYMMSDFALNKKEESKGMYGKRTTLYQNHEFNIEKPSSLFKQEVNFIDNAVYNKSEAYWDENRFERLNKDEKGVYKMLDTLKTVKKFKQMYSLISILGSGYIQYDKFDFGPILSTFGFNEVEGFRVRLGGRTYFGPNDVWRLQGYGAYGFRDHRFKYGLSAKWMVDKRSRTILSAANRFDVEQIGASLTTSNDVLGRSFASSSLLTTSANGKLTDVNFSSFSAEVEPVKNVVLKGTLSYRILESASKAFSLDYYTDATQTATKSIAKQAEANFEIEIMPNRKTTGFGVERRNVDSPFSIIHLNYSHGFTGLLDSGFNYDKLQFMYMQPLIIGPLGRSDVVVEVGKTFGQIPLSLMSAVPGNQNYFTIKNSFNNLNFYEFVTDQYATLKWNHNFGGRLFARVPFLRRLSWREIVGVKTVYGTVSEESKKLNATGTAYIAPVKPYWEYYVGVGNIFKLLRVDFTWRGNYLDAPDAQKFSVKASLGFYF